MWHTWSVVGFFSDLKDGFQMLESQSARLPVGIHVGIHCQNQYLHVTNSRGSLIVMDVRGGFQLSKVHVGGNINAHVYIGKGYQS